MSGTVINLPIIKSLLFPLWTLKGINELEEFSNSQAKKDSAEDAALEDVPKLKGEEAVSHFMVDPLCRAILGFCINQINDNKYFKKPDWATWFTYLIQTLYFTS